MRRFQKGFEVKENINLLLRIIFHLSEITKHAMHEEFALQYADRRAKEKGYESCRIIYREFIIPPMGALKFQAYNEVWLVIYIDWGLMVKSDYGRYDNWYTKEIRENMHEHADRIEIINTRKYQRKIRFLQVILKTRDDGSKT